MFESALAYSPRARTPAHRQAIIADVTYNQKSSANPNEPLPESAVMSAIRKGIQNRVSGVAISLSLSTQRLVNVYTIVQLWRCQQSYAQCHTSHQPYLLHFPRLAVCKDGTDPRTPPPSHTPPGPPPHTRKTTPT